MVPRSSSRARRPSRAVRALAVSCIASLAAASSTWPSEAAAEPARTARSIVEETHRRGRYPTDLVVAPDAEGTAAGRVPAPIFGGRASPTPPPDPVDPWLPDLEFPDWLKALLQAVGKAGWVVVGVVIVAVVVLLVALLYRVYRSRLSMRSAMKPAVLPLDAAPAADPLLAIPTLGHAELARAGRFRDAVHAVLVEALLATGWRPIGAGRSLTAREIVRRSPDGPQPKDALVELHGIVERVWFGGRDADLAVYERTVSLLGRFTGEAR